MIETLHISDLEFRVRRSSRRKTLGLTVDRRSELVVHAPPAVGADELQRWIHGKLLWVHQKLLRKEAHRGQPPIAEFVSGETIAYLGRNYRIRLVETQTEDLAFDGQWFLLRRARVDRAASLFRRWYIDKGEPWMNDRVARWAPKVGTHPKGVTVGDLGFRWGSCSRNGMLHFNWRLLQLPAELIDYLIVHELAHLAEHGHGKVFWSLLDRVLPDWRERKARVDTESCWRRL